MIEELRLLTCRIPPIGEFPARGPISVTEYQDMIAAGLIDEDAAVELLDGELVDKMPQNAPHTYAIRTLAAIFERLLPANYYCARQDPVVLDSLLLEEGKFAVIHGDFTYDGWQRRLNLNY